MNSEQKAHFLFLDGMRGVAALAVVWFHVSHIYNLTYKPEQATLAVDFFFVLSGFVIACAYERRLLSNQIDLREFIGKRTLRLYPMILLGSILGTASTLFVLPAHGNWAQTLVYGASAALLLPIGILSGAFAFPVNTPVWSLFFEVIANVAYAAERLRIKLSNPIQIALVVLSGLVLLTLLKVVGTVVHFGVVGSVQFLAGFVRVTYPFLAGVLAFRLVLPRLRTRLPTYLLAAVLAAALLVPIAKSSWAYEAFMIIVVFPVIVALGAKARSTAIADRVWKLAGRLSYPLYLVHMPILMAAERLLSAASMDAGARNGLALVTVAVSVALAYIVLIFYDEPIRAWLDRRASRPIVLDKAAPLPTRITVDDLAV